MVGLLRSQETRSYWQKTHKYGVELPKTIEEAYKIDRKTNTRHWRNAIEKEMKNVMVAFDFDDEETVPIAHQRIGVHMVFDVRITLDRKAAELWVALQGDGIVMFEDLGKFDRGYSLDSGFDKPPKPCIHSRSDQPRSKYATAEFYLGSQVP